MSHQVTCLVYDYNGVYIDYLYIQYSRVHFVTVTFEFVVMLTRFYYYACRFTSRFNARYLRGSGCCGVEVLAGGVDSGEETVYFTLSQQQDKTVSLWVC